MSAEKQIKQEALTRLRDNNWGKAIAVTVALLCVPIIQSLCNEFAAYLFHVNLNCLAQSWWEFFRWMLNRMRNWPYFLFWIVSTLLFWALTSPLSLGAVRWNLHASQGQSPAVEELFYYFSNRRLFVRSLSCSLQLLLRYALWGIVCFAPGVILVTVCSTFGNAAYAPIQQIPLWAVIGISLSSLLFLAGGILFIFFSLRYFAAQTAVAALDSRPVHACINLSVRRMKKRKGSAFVLMLSFLGWGLLCFFVIPALFVIPYFRMSRVTCAKWILIQDIREEYESLHPVPDSPSNSIEKF